MIKKFLHKKKKIILPVLFLGVVILIAFKLLVSSYFLKSDLKVDKMTVGNQTFNVEFAQTKSQRERGLSYRDNLGKYNGMLFAFDAPGIYPFWMKEMNFPLDFLWIRDNKIVDLSESIPPPKSVNGQIMFVTPKEPVNAVVEINAGLIQELHIQEGDLITLK